MASIKKLNQTREMLKTGKAFALTEISRPLYMSKKSVNEIFDYLEEQGEIIKLDNGKTIMVQIKKKEEEKKEKEWIE